MKARIYNRVVEIPDERMVKGGVVGTRIGQQGDCNEQLPDLCSRQAPKQGRKTEGRPLKPLAGSNPAPSPLIFTLKGQMKSGKNRVLITKTGHRYAPKEFRVWRESMVNQICMELGIDRMMIVTPVSLIVDYVPGDLIKRDVDGMLSALFHVIVKAGILQDDAQIKNVQWHQWPLDRQNPQVRVVLTSLHTDT